MHTFDDIVTAYRRQVRLPWLDDVPPAGRVWMVWYDKSMQRRFTGRLYEFETATREAGHGWLAVNIAPWIASWLANHDFFEALLMHPQELRGLLPDLEAHLVERLRGELGHCTANDMLAVDGCGAAFGFARVSTLLGRVSDAIPGRMMVGFPGKHRDGVYRLLDARDGWNYHAVPIPSDSAL